MSRFLPAVGVVAALALGLLPLQAGPGTATDAEDLSSDYDGRYRTTDGSDEGGLVDFDPVTQSGKNFSGTLAYSPIGSCGVRPSGVGPFQVTGTVSTTGKIKIAGEISPGLKFSAKGQVSDLGQLIIAAYQVKQGKTVQQKGICWLQEDGPLPPPITDPA
jgi:hypothetical protein